MTLAGSWFGRLAAVLVGLSVSGCQPESNASDGNRAAAETGVPVAAGGNFDFYVLALSWSPSYCEAEGENANRQQCSARRPHAFIVHGLWPQFERGFPESCSTAEPDVANEKLRTLYDLIPSAGLIRHQWRRHGSCSGLAQEDYFDVLRAARDRIVIPDEMAPRDDYRMVDPDDAEQAFIEANDGLSAAGISVTCEGRYLREVRICLTRELGFRACPEIDRRACRRDRVVMPPARGA